MRIDFESLSREASPVAQAHNKTVTAPITFSVDYPYDISKSVLPHHLNQEINYLSTKKLLPQATIRFLTRQIQKELQKTPEKIIKRKQQHDLSGNSNNFRTNPSSILIEQEPPQNKSPFYQKPFSVVQFRGQAQTSSNPKPNSKGPNTVKKKSLLSELLDEWTARKSAKGKKKISVNENLKNLTSGELKRFKQIMNQTYKPELTLTASSTSAKVIMKKRQKHFEKGCNVFQHLYNDAHRYQTKRSLQKIIIEEERRLTSNQIHTSRSQRSFDGFYQRLAKSLEKVGENKRLAEKYRMIDMNTGSELHRPDISLSKHSYVKHFKPVAETIKAAQQSKHSKTRLAQKSLQKFSEKATTMAKIQSLYQERVGEAQTRKSSKSQYLAEAIQKSTIDWYVVIFYPDDETEDFQRNYNSMLEITEVEYRILEPFFSSVEEFQKTGKVGRHIFQALLKQFYKKLTLYDKQILRENCMPRRAELKFVPNRTTREKKNGSARRNQSYSSSLYYI